MCFIVNHGKKMLQCIISTKNLRLGTGKVALRDIYSKFSVNWKKSVY